MRQFQKVSLSGAMIFTLAMGIGTGAANAGGTEDASHADGSYYYYEVDAHGNKTHYIEGLTEKGLEDELGYPYNGERSHYYYEVNEEGEQTKYINGLTKEELKERLHQYNMQAGFHSDGHMNMESKSHSGGHMNHSAEEMSSSGEVPEDLQTAENPTYPVGSTAVIQADHMHMDGAEATISGAFDTTVYTVSYIPTTGGEMVEDHKWVIHEELVDPGGTPLQPGDEAVMKPPTWKVWKVLLRR